MKTSSTKYNWQRWSVEFISTFRSFRDFNGFYCHKHKFTALAKDKSADEPADKQHFFTIKTVG